MPKREIFIDSVKIYACILVVLGHFFQSVTQSHIVADNAFLQWFDTTIYYFHVPLFFVCSGYLYQKYSKVNTFCKYKNNVVKKALALLIPYFAFSLITWLMKVVFSSSVNTQADGLFETLFLQPLSPYWYLYILFFVFVITPTFWNNKSCVIALVVALSLKVATFFFETGVFLVDITCEYLIWFVLGMCMSQFAVVQALKRKAVKVIAVVFSVIFVISSVLIQIFYINAGVVSLLMGFYACFATVTFFVNVEHHKLVQSFTHKFSQYTMPVFLMHTIFAAALRVLLIKLSITNSVIHIILGLAISFVGPVVAAMIMAKVKWINFLLYPNKYIFKSRGKDNG